MKKTFKRAGVAVLSMAMLLSMGAVGAMTASAETTGGTNQVWDTLANGQAYKEVTMPSASATYQVYKLASATLSGHIFEYTLTGDASGLAKTFFEQDADSGIISVKNAIGSDIAAGTALHSLSASQAQALATALETDIKNGTHTASKVGSDLAASATVQLQPGYYIVIATTADVTQPILLSVANNSAQTLTAKSTSIPFTKEIVTIDGATTRVAKDTAGNDGGTGVAKAGSTVAYKISTEFPTYDTTTVKEATYDAGTGAITGAGTDITNFVITDDPEATIVIAKGTNYSGVTVKVDNSTVAKTADGAADNAKTYTIVDNTGTNGGAGFKITFDDNFVIRNAGNSVTVEFNATVTNPTTGTDSNDNDADLVYGNNYNTGGGSGTAQDDTEIYCTLFTVDKLNENGSPLEGAAFKLSYKEAAGDSYTAISTLSGAAMTEFSWSGLQDGYYKLEETTVPDGYKGIEAVEFTVTAGQTTVGTSPDDYQYYNGTFTFTGVTVSGANNKMDVTNYPGQILPGTGGMGTVLFTVGGAAIVLLAGAMFVVYMRKRKVEE